jgi:hypothetical protein
MASQTFTDIGCTFSYPVFDGWPVRAIEKKSDDERVIWLGWPDNIEFEVPPVITIARRGSLSEPSYFTAGAVAIATPQESLLHVAYDLVYFPAHYVNGYDPKGHWDALRFTDGIVELYIHIPIASEHSFSREEFVQQVIDTFRFV